MTMIAALVRRRGTTQGNRVQACRRISSHAYLPLPWELLCCGWPEDVL
jgi:hypothetical protein